MARESRQIASEAGTQLPEASGRDGGAAAADAERNAPVLAGEGISAFLYDANGEDREVTLEPALVDGLADDDLLWVDVDSSQEGAIEALTAVIPAKEPSLFSDVSSANHSSATTATRSCSAC